MPNDLERRAARRLWKSLETLHAVVYFAPGIKAAGEAAGLKGFWMTYFAFRAAPMGPVSPAVVTATFAGFAPAMVRRALPDAWSMSTPAACLDARAAASRAALEDVGVTTSGCEHAAELLAPVLPALDSTGRPLGAANAELPLPDDPLTRVWQLATTLREHRGDGHVAALTSAGVGGPEPHLLQSAAKGLPAEQLRGVRGWTPEDWADAAQRFTERGLLNGEQLTDAGRELLDAVESTTDDLAWTGGLQALSVNGVDAVIDALQPAVQAVVSSGVIPYPNPMGAPKPS